MIWHQDKKMQRKKIRYFNVSQISLDYHAM